jgi:AmmeMemoRadiSam system protein B
LGGAVTIYISFIPNTEIIPILFSQQNHQNAKYLKDKLIEVIKDDLDKTLFVISSDFSHYHSASTARTLD